MNKVLFLTTLVCIFVASISCVQFSTIIHEEKDAAKIAAEFANIAFIEKDYQKAYLLLADVTKESLTFEKFSDTISKIHATGYPAKVIATEFEPSPGQKAMSIFLQGKNEKEEFHYRFYMIGTESEGYKVGGFFRGNGPCPPSQLRQSLR